MKTPNYSRTLLGKAIIFAADQKWNYTDKRIKNHRFKWTYLTKTEATAIRKRLADFLIKTGVDYDLRMVQHLMYSNVFSVNLYINASMFISYQEQTEGASEVIQRITDERKSSKKTRNSIFKMLKKMDVVIDNLKNCIITPEQCLDEFDKHLRNCRAILAVDRAK